MIYRGLLDKPGKCLGHPKEFWEKGPLMATYIGTFYSDSYKPLKPPIKALYSAPQLPQKPLSGAPSRYQGASMGFFTLGLPRI